MTRLLVVCLAVAAHLSLVEAQTLPAGAGAEIIKARCVSCHETDLITSQRLGAGGWTRELDKMMRWGATIAPEQREVLQAYLVANFGPAPAPSHAANSAAGEATFKRACLSCHGTDLIEQQRLNRAGWGRSVDKMVRWGADVSAADKDALVDHLTARFSHR